MLVRVGKGTVGRRAPSEDLHFLNHPAGDDVCYHIDDDLHGTGVDRRYEMVLIRRRKGQRVRT